MITLIAKKYIDPIVCKDIYEGRIIHCGVIHHSIATFDRSEYFDWRERHIKNAGVTFNKVILIEKGI